MTQRPNIIFIVADDLGFADLGCYGGRDAKFGKVSPVLDQLAAAGLKFTQGYANSPVCSPTRFALMTARYQYRLRGGADEPINSKSKGSTVLGLPPEHPTLPSLLKASGYRTALIGKWHLGYPPHFSPLKSGYEEGKAKQNSLLYVYDNDTNKALWVTYDKNLDAWTKAYLGENPGDADQLDAYNLFSKYNSKFTYSKEAPAKDLAGPTIQFIKETFIKN